MSHSYLAITVLIVTCSAMVNTALPPRPVDGGWSPWGPWTRCSKTCEGGIHIRMRTCTIPRTSGAGRRCFGANYERRRCPCTRVNGGWSGYGSWGRCSKTCGGGTRTRYRTCTNPRPSCCGVTCLGLSSQTGRCNTQRCRPIEAMAKRFAKAVMYNKVSRRVKTCHTRRFTCIASSGAMCAPAADVCKDVCTYGDRDFLMIMDSSGSITQTDYDAAKLDLALVATSLCGNLGTDLQVATMQFSRNPKKQFPFDEYADVIDLFDGVMVMTRLGSITRTWTAFNFAKNIMFTSVNGNRPAARKQALIVTDGKSNGASNAKALSIAAAQKLKNSGVELFALWIGAPRHRDLNEIRAYASDPVEDHVFSVDTVKSLHEFVVEIWLIHNKICCKK